MQIEGKEIQEGYFVTDKVINELAVFGLIKIGYIRTKSNEVIKSSVKILRPQTQDEKRFAQREIQIVKQIKHRNIVPTYEVIELNNGKEIYIFQQYDQFLPLDKYFDQLSLAKKNKTLDKFKQYNDDIILNWAAELINCFSYLSENSIHNRNLIPSNIVINKETLTPLIFDFGSAKQDDIDPSGQLGITPSMCLGLDQTYQCPQNAGIGTDEEMDNLDYEKFDVWSLGIILYQLAESELPWKVTLYEDNCEKIYDNIANDGVQFNQTKNQGLIEIIRKMIVVHQDKRESFLQLSLNQHIQMRMRSILKEELLLKNGRDLFLKYEGVNKNGIEQISEIEEIIHLILLKLFTKNKSVIYRGTEIETFYRKLLASQISKQYKLTSEFVLKRKIKKVFKHFLNKIKQEQQLNNEEIQLLKIILEAFDQQNRDQLNNEKLIKEISEFN